MVNKRTSPDYKKVDGFIPKELQLRFKRNLLEQSIDVNVGIEEAVEFWISKFEGDTVRSTATAIFFLAILERERPKESLFQEVACELGIEKEKLRRLVTLLFGEENPHIIE